MMVACCSEEGRLIMGFMDIVLMVVIIGGALYILYRSVWKKKGHCSGCDSGTCDRGKKINPEDS